ncbi:exo-alpha-sialidase [Nonomuraea sp. SBT364]|uniref:exo-alpha-sialidase n=1 Tax=Nonomuraea sp. SBT364 TaxID=1580530 RepID=UPI0012E2DF31|nr:exo-alpha-sialidase [Nonomuraea sp. SBT364]
MLPARGVAGVAYCRVPDAKLTDPAWIYPSPRPASAEPGARERLDFAGFPNASAIDTAGTDGSPTQRVLVTYSRNVDAVMAYTSAEAVSVDGGVTFGAPADTPLREAPIQLHDGRLFATAYYLTRQDEHTNRLPVFTSAGVGQPWTRTEATFSSPGELIGGGVAHGLPIQLADGTILVSVYTRYTDTGEHQAEVYASADGGLTFARRGVIARPAGGHVYNEAAIEQTADGSLLAVLRREGGQYATLATSRSSDGGVTWSPVRELAFEGQNCLVRGVAPRLLLMPGGTLVLSAGRPDVWLAQSRDGLGETWADPLVTYHNRDGVYDAHGTSGYTGVAAVGPYRLLQVFDNCKLPGVRPGGGLNETACPARGRFEHGSWYGIRHRTIDLPEPAPGRLDLAALHRAGTLAVDSTMTWSSASRPRTRASGAFDGSTAYWSSAVAAGGPGTLTLGFDRARSFTRIALSLRPGHPAGARVYVSADGVSWGEPVATVTDRTDYAMRHLTFDPPVEGKHVRIVADESAGCDPEIGATCAMLNEVELYAEP